MKQHGLSNFRTFYLMLCIVFYASILRGQTQFTGPANGDWFTVANWSNGLPAIGNNATIPGGASVVINAPLSTAFKIESFGTLTNNSTLTIGDTLFSGALFTNTGTITANASARITSSGGLNNSGTLNNAGIITSNSLFTNSATGVLTNDGTISQLANFTNDGVINNKTGIFTCYQLFNNNKTLKNLVGAAFTMEIGSNFTNAIGADLSNAGTFKNFSTFTNNAQVTNLGIFQNNGLQICNGTFDNLSGGVVDNPGTISVEGTWNNDAGATTTVGFKFIVLNFGTVQNFGTFQNNNLLHVQGGGIFNNLAGGLVNSFFGSMINNDGDIIVALGSTIMTNGEINNTNFFENDGTIESNSGAKITNSDRFMITGLLKNVNLITNNSEMTLTGTIENNSGGAIVNAGIFLISSTAKILNNFDITNLPGSALRNDGLILNNLRLFNDGVFENNGTFTIVGDFLNRPTGVFTNNGITEVKTGAITNQGQINNTKTLINGSCSVVKNLATIDNTGGLFENRGILFQRGTVTGNAIVAAGGIIQTSATSDAPSVCIPTLNTGADVIGEAKVYAQSLMNVSLGLDTCVGFQYFVEDVNRKVYTCDQIGQTLTAHFRLVTRTGDSLTCSTQVTVTDNIQPTITNCPANLTATTFDTCSLVTWTEPTAADNCPNLTITVVSSPTAGLKNGSCFPVGTTTVTYNATDANGYTATCNFTVTVTKIDICVNDNVAPVIANCPSSQALTTTDTCALATWKTPTVTDNCSTPSVILTSAPTTGLVSGSCFPIGTTTLTYTATDAKGNFSTCSFDIIITKIDTCLNDAVKPILSNCSTNQALSTTDTCKIATWSAPTATDNCSTPSVVLTSAPKAGLVSGSCFPIGTTTLTYTATDAKGNFATCSFDIVVTKIDTCLNDAVKPILSSCPTNQALSTTDTCKIATWAAPTATDNCSTPSVILTSAPKVGLVSGSCFPIGTTTLTYTATDAKGNFSTCSFDIVVTKIDTCLNDAVKPVLSICPTNQAISTTDTCKTATCTAPTATDNCSTPSVILTSAPKAGLVSGSCFPIGTTTLTYTATDAKGNFSTCSFDIVVTKIDTCLNDVVKPILSNCPVNQAISTTDTCKIATWTAPTATDNCSTALITLASAPKAGLTSGSCFPIGTTTLTYTATDAKGNFSTCSFNVVVTKIDTCLNDVVKPVLSNCPTNQGLSTTDTCKIATWTAPSATDNCSTPSVILASAPKAGLVSGSCFPIGTTTLTYTATDAKGNFSTCIFNVIVTKIDTCLNDVVKPILSNCPTNQAISTTDTCKIATWTAPTATDNCSTPSVILTSAPKAGLVSGSCFPIGTTTLTYTATDAKGNFATCSFDIVVTKIDTCLNDVVKPVLSNCPTNQAISTTDTCKIATWAAPTATDNCSTALITLASAPKAGLVSGSCFPIGATTLTYTATDAKGNFATCGFDIVVTKIDTCLNDAVKPVLSNCPTNQALSTTDTCKIATWTAPTATDNCSTALITLASAPTAGFVSGSCFPIGTTTLTYTATDAKGNFSTCSFDIVVTKIDTCLNDAVKPVLSNCPTNQALSTTDTCKIATWTTPTATDNCSTALITLASAPKSGLVSGSCFPIGTTTLTYTATDAKGNFSTCSFDIVVTKIDTCLNDAVKPVLSNCPTNQALSTTDTCKIATWAAPTATDNCSTPSVILTSAPTTGLVSGSCFPIGTTTLTYTATDAKGNFSTCSFDIVVTKIDTCLNDAVKPILSNCPINQALSTTDTCKIATWSAPTATDNCSTPSVVLTSAPKAGLTSGSCFPIGTTTLTYTATDAKGNFSTCSFDIVVTKIDTCLNDAVKPVLSNCPTNQALSTTDTCKIATWSAPTATDNCSTPSVILTSSPKTGLVSGSCFPIGTTTLTYTAKDAKNNVATCSFTITVKSEPFQFDPNKCYKIVSKAGKVLDLDEDDFKDGTYINQTTYDNMVSQQWQFLKLADGSFKIINRFNGKLLACHKTTNGSRVYQWDNINNSAKYWKVEPIAGGNFKIINVYSKKSLDLLNNSSEEDAPIGIWDYNGGNNQMWQIVEVPCQSTSNCIQYGSVTREVWYNQTDATFPIAIPKTAPNLVTTETGLEGPRNVRDNYKTRVQGYFIAPTSGKYIFNITGDDNVELYISSNTSSKQLKQVAHIKGWTNPDEENKFASQTSKGIDFKKGKLYYFELRHKEFGGGDHYRVRWKLPNTRLRDGFQIISSQFLARPCAGQIQGANTNQVFTFVTKAEYNQAKLQWITNTGYQNDYFEVERLNANSNFESLNKINANTGNDALKVFDFTDANPMEGDNFYRIKTVLLDGTPQYSEVKKVNFSHLGDVAIFPNPADEYIDVDLKKYEGKEVNLYVYNQLGKLMQVVKVEKVSSTLQRLDTQSFTTGSYFIRVQASGVREVTKQFKIAK